MNSIKQKIPEGWSVKKLGELGDIVSGGTPDTENSTFWDGNIYWLTPSEVTKLPTKYVYQTERTITKEGLKNSSAKLLPKNSLIICTRATVGDCCINAVPMSTNQGFKNIILYEGDNIIYLYYLIANNKFQFIRKACGSTFLEISKKDVSNLKFLLPPLPEQEKIAGILSCWDDGIEKLSALIEKKKIQKKALMQQLLTGKHRLKGFSTQWDERYLVDLCDFNKGQQLNKADMLVNGRYPVLNGGVSYSGYTNDWNTKNNTITISEGGNSCGFVSFIKEKFWCGGHCYTVFDIKTDIMFLYHLLKYNENNIMNLRVGSGLPNIQISSLYRFKVLVPSDFAEQKAIAEILSKADEEIELLNKKLEAFKQEKKALMQQLLTGKIRVKVN